MAEEVDSELKSAVTDPSGGSLLGDKTTEEGESIQHTTSSAQDSQTQIRFAENNKSPTNIQRPKEAEKTTDIKERGDVEAEQESEPSLTDVDPSGDSTPDVAEESPTNIQRPEEAEKTTDIKERGDVEAEQEPERSSRESPTNIQKPKEAEKARDIKERGDVEAEQESEPSLTEPLQHTASSGLPQESQSQTRLEVYYKLWWIPVCVVFAAMVCGYLLDFSDSTPPVPKELKAVDVFNQEMEKLKTSFPNQRPELWRRSLIHLRRHLKTEQPTEPVSLILTSGHRAEKTLGCLARCLAQAFSTARNSSVLNINGESKASQDSDQVKLDIDSELRNAFEGKTFAAVIHRFEELPPGSTLIFYRYCDHENAAFKNVFLAFTVMLNAEVEVPFNVSLGRVEEMVQEHLKQKFVSSDKLATFNQMDVDKLSGLWSRISHLILPVAAEEKIEHQGCGDSNKSF